MRRLSGPACASWPPCFIHPPKCMLACLFHFSPATFLRAQFCRRRCDILGRLCGAPTVPAEFIHSVPASSYRCSYVVAAAPRVFLQQLCLVVGVKNGVAKCLHSKAFSSAATCGRTKKQGREMKERAEKETKCSGVKLHWCSNCLVLIGARCGALALLESSAPPSWPALLGPEGKGQSSSGEFSPPWGGAQPSSGKSSSKLTRCRTIKYLPSKGSRGEGGEHMVRRDAAQGRGWEAARGGAHHTPAPQPRPCWRTPIPRNKIRFVLAPTNQETENRRGAHFWCAPTSYVKPSCAPCTNGEPPENTSSSPSTQRGLV